MNVCVGEGIKQAMEQQTMPKAFPNLLVRPCSLHGASSYVSNCPWKTWFQKYQTEKPQKLKKTNKHNF